jgi:WD40 repeat protein
VLVRHIQQSSDPSSSKLLLFEQGHKFRVTALCFDPTNEYVATGSFDNTACVWHAINGICRNVLIGHSGPVTGMAFLSFGPFLITSSADRTARVWHILTGEQLFNLSSHSNAIVCVSLNSAGMVATASVDRTARLWDLRPPWGEKSGSEISCMRGHKGVIRDIKLEPNGRVGMSVSDDGSVRIWNVLKGTLTRHFTGHLYPVNTCAFLPIQGQESRSVHFCIRILSLELSAQISFLVPSSLLSHRQVCHVR